MKLPFALTLLLLISPVVAQEPLPWAIDVDDTEMDSTVENATAGDWYEVELFNIDEVYHNITLGPYGTYTLPPLGGVDVAPFQMGMESFTVSDDITGTSFEVRVSEGDSIDQENSASSSAASQGSSAESEDSPMPIGLAFLALVALALRKK